MVDYFFWVAVACCIAAQAAIVRAALRVPTGNAAAGADVPRPRRAMEIAWALVPAAVLALVLVFTWRAIHASEAPASAPRGEMLVERAS